MSTERNTDKRVKFDFEVEFSNGGGIQGQDFRLDVHGDDISDQALADYIVRDMHLLMVGEVRILNKEIIEEKHKRAASPQSPAQKIVDVSHAVEDGMITYKGLPAPIICDYLSREESREHYAEGTEDGERPVHTTLLGGEIPICEHMTGLEGLPDRGARFFAAPVKVKGFGTFPVRAFGVVEG